MPYLDIPVADLIRQRYSCRIHDRRPVPADVAAQLAYFAASVREGPFGVAVRFVLAAASGESRNELKGLGTYGLIKNAPAFIIGAVGPGKRNLEDYGYGLEAIILHVTGLGLGTCWLGGNFTRSSFSRRVEAEAGEIVPAVASVGYAAQDSRSRDRLRRMAGSDSRLPWADLFSEAGSGAPLTPESAGAYAGPLEMVRLAPSASNRQPWRVVQDGEAHHFCLERSPGYGPGSLPFRVMGMADLQRVDLGIAMCHFDLSAREAGLPGEWEVRDPSPEVTARIGEYVATWAPAA